VIRDATAKKRKDSVQRSSDILSSQKIIKIARTEPLEEEDIIEDEEFEDYEEGEVISDPLEPFNRAVFVFNDRLYFLVIKPLAQGYANLVPEDFRVVIKNFFHNITAPVRVINCLLQGKVKDAANEVLRFSINTTVGVFGLAPVAESFGIKGKEEDFGQTLAVYGVGQGPYLVLPIIGPSSLRDLVGTATDAFLDPLNHISRLETVAAIQSYKYINKTSLHLGEYEELKASALDPYTALKDAYVQYRDEEVKK
jgi:phospholipid-binding lipoprotein MlaA